ncbi:MAG: DUF3784 domain-containing protein [Oscillospiraceae bacterium]|nr:DUF3784 domain-containing protein [Oscillospiraceae bacterium]
MLAMIICWGLAGLFIITGIFMLTGRGTFLISGYNTMSKSEKAKFEEKFDIKLLCRFIGKILIALGLPNILIGFPVIASISWLGWIYTVVVFAICIFAVIYANTSKSFRK